MWPSSYMSQFCHNKVSSFCSIVIYLNIVALKHLNPIKCFVVRRVMINALISEPGWFMLTRPVWPVFQDWRLVAVFFFYPPFFWKLILVEINLRMNDSFARQVVNIAHPTSYLLHQVGPCHSFRHAYLLKSLIQFPQFPPPVRSL